jgi:hypothetical protein
LILSFKVPKISTVFCNNPQGSPALKKFFHFLLSFFEGRIECAVQADLFSNKPVSKNAKAIGTVPVYGST